MLATLKNIPHLFSKLTSVGDFKEYTTTTGDVKNTGTVGDLEKFTKLSMIEHNTATVSDLRKCFTTSDDHIETTGGQTLYINCRRS